MRRVEHLIKQIRRHTENVTESGQIAGANDGISDMEVVEALSNAQERLVAAIHLTNNKLLTKESVITPVASQELYDLPFDIYTDSHIVDFQWSSTGQARDYRTLERVSFKERHQVEGNPTRYILRAKKVLVNPIPTAANQSGLIQYNPRLPKLDIRRGQVDVATLTADAITTLTLDNAWGVALADASFDEIDALCVVDRDGIIKMKNIPIDSVNTTTGAVTVASGFTFDAGETIAVDDYVVLGEYATTHSELPELAERYLLMFSYKRLFFRDCSTETVAQDKELKELEAEIIESIGTISSDVEYIAILNDEFC